MEPGLDQQTNALALLPLAKPLAEIGRRSAQKFLVLTHSLSPSMWFVNIRTMKVSVVKLREGQKAAKLLFNPLGVGRRLLGARKGKLAEQLYDQDSTFLDPEDATV